MMKREPPTTNPMISARHPLVGPRRRRAAAIAICALFTLPLAASAALARTPIEPPSEPAEAIPLPLPAGDDDIRCPGDDPFFFDEVREAGWLGYGETWDLHTCDQGREIFAEGANRRWRKMRPRLARKPLGFTTEDAEFYSAVVPYLAFGSLGLIFAGAFGVSLITRRRRGVYAVASCEACGTRVPIRADEGGMFCPACGTGIVLQSPSSPGAPGASSVSGRPSDGA